MTVKNKVFVWVDLEKPKNVFTVRSAAMYDLRNKKMIQHYLANTKIQVVQKAIFNGETYYRTESAKTRGLDWAFKATAFGLPNEAAPSVPSPKSDSLGHLANSRKSRSSAPTSAKKQTVIQKAARPQDGEGKRRGWLKKIFRRKND